MAMQTVMIIPTKRPPPIKTLESYPEIQDQNRPFLILADPDVFNDHQNQYGRLVRYGGRGVGPQIANMYALAASEGFTHWIKVDDDLTPDTFVAKGYDPDFEEVCEELEECVLETGATLAGVANSSNTSWLSAGVDYKKTYGLIHGGTNIAIATMNPLQFIDIRLRRNGDVYRTCAHRQKTGFVGRVGHIGFNKKGSTMNASTIPDDQESIDIAKELILAKFPDLVKCDGTMDVHGRSFPNWRMLRGPRNS